jgi:hypothetical protein
MHRDKMSMSIKIMETHVDRVYARLLPACEEIGGLLFMRWSFTLQPPYFLGHGKDFASQILLKLFNMCWNQSHITILFA